VQHADQGGALARAGSARPFRAWRFTRVMPSTTPRVHGWQTPAARAVGSRHMPSTYIWQNVPPLTAAPRATDEG
jgi:hypothetical protein